MFGSSREGSEGSRRCVANVTLLAEVPSRGHTFAVLQAIRPLVRRHPACSGNPGGDVKRAWVILTAVVLAAACGRLKVTDDDKPSEAQMTLRAVIGRPARPPFVTA